MKLRNKKTCEIVDTKKEPLLVNSDGRRFMVLDKVYDSLAKLNEEWEDYKEPEVIYYLSWDGMVLHSADKTGWQNAKQIGNYFETEEEAEKAVEKLKALKRLKDKGFRFRTWFWRADCGTFIRFEYIDDDDDQNKKDLDLLFGGEE